MTELCPEKVCTCCLCSAKRRFNNDASLSVSERSGATVTRKGQRARTKDTCTHRVNPHKRSARWRASVSLTTRTLAPERPCVSADQVWTSVKLGVYGRELGRELSFHVFHPLQQRSISMQHLLHKCDRLRFACYRASAVQCVAR